MHIPVLLNEVIRFLNPQSNKNFIDCTLGGGGHSKAILEKTGPTGKLLAIDLDAKAIESFQQYVDGQGLGKRVILINDNFSNLKEIVRNNDFRKIKGILLDLGFSSDQLENSGRGFSFLRNEPLDMRLGKDGTTAADIINNFRFEELAKIFREYGEEKYGGKIARVICEERRKIKIKTTQELVAIVLKAKFGSAILYPHHRIHPATKVFQALRIAVNQELENLKKALAQAIDVLEPGGKIVVIAFHSLEDRIVKNFFREQKQNGAANILTKKPVIPLPEEIKINPRSRSAKLRVAEKI